MKNKRIACILALFCALTLILSFPVYASGKTCSLTLNCAVGGNTVQGVKCSLYKVADVNGTAFQPLAAFEKAQIKINGITTESEWQSAANSLATYAGADANNVKAAAEAYSNGNGSISFKDLSTGLYLAVFSQVTSGRTTYSFSPDLIALPQWDGNGNVAYDVTAAPKGTKTTHGGGGGGGSSDTDVTILKVWDDSTDQSKRPSSISVTLLKDGKTYDTQTLTADNNWRHKWTGLSKDYDWTAIETDVPDNYTVTYKADGYVLTVTNSVTTNIPDTPVPNNPYTPVPDQPVPGSPGTNTPGTPTTTNTPGTPGTTVSKTEKLPQTGQLWWPVPVLTVVGLLLFAIGWNKKNEDDEK